MDRIRCTECGEEAFKWDMFNTWLRLVHSMDFLYKNDDITYELYSSLVDDLMHFKKFAMDEDDKNNEFKQWEIKELEELESDLREKGMEEQANKVNAVLCSMVD